MPPKGYKKHCCACISSEAKQAVYCCIGRPRFCARHKRWYEERNALLKAASDIDVKLAKLSAAY